MTLNKPAFAIQVLCVVSSQEREKRILHEKSHPLERFVSLATQKSS